MHRAHLARAAWDAHLMPCDVHLMPSVVDETAQCSSGPCCRAAARSARTPALGRRGRQHFLASTFPPALSRQHFLARAARTRSAEADSSSSARAVAPTGRSPTARSRTAWRACHGSDRAQPDSAESHSADAEAAARTVRHNSTDADPRGRCLLSMTLTTYLPYQTPFNPALDEAACASTSLPS